MNKITMKDVSHSYGEKQVLNHFNLNLEPGKVTALLGPSGSGKTTVLNILAGLTRPDSGSVEGESLRVSCVFQEVRLLPWRTVSGNLAFVLKGQLPAEELDTRMEGMLQLVELWEERHSWPHQLSGGMKQRVALARALAVPAELLLMDEPFKGLDNALRNRIMERCRILWRTEGKTVLLVTHDSAEASYLADETVVIA